jgi:CheY-like chemotaxis protein
MMDTVLLVEDDKFLLKVFTTGLTQFSDKFRVLTAENGEMAIDILKQQTIDLLITDLVMPKMDGLALIAYKNEHFPRIPCIVVTGQGSPEIKRQLSQKVLQYIEKPIKPKELAAVISNALDQDALSGTMNVISIANFLQLIEMERRTCFFEIDSSAADPKGVFYFKEGVLYDAVFGNLKGMAAALKMIQIESSKIKFKKPPPKKIKRRINQRLAVVIMEAMRRKDELITVSGKERLLKYLLGELNKINGFKAAAILNSSGETVINLAETDDLANFADHNVFKTLFRLTREMSQTPGLGEIKESVFIGRQGFISTIASRLKIGKPIYLISLFEMGANRSFVRLTQEKIILRIIEEIT